jgi:hypothetical protein
MSEEIKVRNARYLVQIERDDDYGAPWENEDGHGPVTDWTTRDKCPGELVLNQDRRSYRYYDFQAACRIARRDGWGFLPGELETKRHATRGPKKFRASVRRRPELVAYGPDINSAIRALYDLHRSTFPSARAYAAAAARADYERLRQWCDDQWCYVGVIVTRLDRHGNKLRHLQASLWGIESDAGDYLEEVARELVADIESMNRKAA